MRRLLGMASAMGVIVLVAWQARAGDAPAAAIRPTQLRCEMRINPLAIDTPRPRLSWICEAIDPKSRGLAQSAYQVLAASSESALAKDQGDLWDSGKVTNGQSILVEYAGKPLASNQRCVWKVRLWDQAGNPSPWSEPAGWSMGLLEAKDWSAKWIMAPDEGGATLEGLKWVWTSDGDAKFMAPEGTRYFRTRVELPAEAKVRRAMVLMAADNGFVLHVNGKEVLRGDSYKQAASADIAAQLRPGVNILAVAATNGGREAGLLGRIVVELEDGTQRAIPVDGKWKASLAPAEGWMEAAFDDSGWESPRELGEMGCAPWGKVSGPARPLPLLRRSFDIDKPIRRAVVHVCGLGHYELRVNGSAVTDTVLDPGWTNYRKTAYYDSRDVTALLRQGKNALGVMLGNGMYNVTGGRYVKFTGSFGPPKLILQLEVEHEDGTRTTIVSDGSWKTAPGPIVFSCIYGGEDYDARLELPGCDTGDFADETWAAARPADGPGGELRASIAPPLAVMREYAAKVSQPKPGVFVYDLGQNFSGWPKLSVSGKAGSTVKMIPGELLNEDGTVSQRSSGGPVWFAYTLKGQGQETWSPRFSYSGFRYVQVEGGVPAGEESAPADLPRIAGITGQFIYVRTPVVGQFECSNDLVNRIHALINAAILSNYKSVLTDCPHREKLGWLECTHLLGGCFMYNYDSGLFYAKIARDMREAQLENGLVPDIAPEYTVFNGGFRDSPEWGSASVISPWLAWQFYGDRRPLEESYDMMKRYAAYLQGRAADHILSHGLGDWYDIGPAGPGASQLTSMQVTATGVYFQDLAILQRVAALLGKPQEAEDFARRAGAVRAAFNKKLYTHGQGHYDRNSQTANAMPLVLGLVEAEHRAAVLENLVKSIRAAGNRVTAGDVGFHYVVHALMDGGRDDVLYDMVCQTQGPGYAYQLAKGATSLTEAWDTNPGSSQNHCMLGHAEEWFYRGLAGIQPDLAGPGFKRFVIRPAPVAGLGWVKAHHDSPHGRISVAWKLEGRAFTLDLVVPPNTGARVLVPATSAQDVAEGGLPAGRAPGVKFMGMVNSTAVFEVGSGGYRFTSAMPKKAE